MIFASLFFLYVFLPLNLILYFALPNIKLKNAVLIIFSLFFYAWGEPVFVFVMLGTALLDYLHGLFIEKFRGSIAAKIAMITAAVTDIGILAVFKYLGFFVSNINMLLHVNIPIPDIALPIGISFYTFQTLTYVVDVYRGKVHAQRNYFRYLLFLTSYFQLVAGPIVRYEYVEKAIDNRRTTLSGFSYGVRRFVFGLGKKVLIANAAGELVAKYMDGDIGKLSVCGAWLGMFMFTIQLYFDFSGYSDMAIGLGAMFGFKFPENFDYPYISCSVSEFWRRWHITLGSFFRDYVYIPLGGNRRHLFRNLLVVWFLTGFWHGAAWNFVLWGLYNGLFIMLERYLKSKTELRMPKALSHIYLILCVNFGFVLFYFSDTQRLASYFGALFGSGQRPFFGADVRIDLLNNLFWLILALLLCTPIYRYIDAAMNYFEYRTAKGASVVPVVRGTFIVAVLALSTAFLVGNGFNPFLYFNF